MVSVQLQLAGHPQQASVGEENTKQMDNACMNLYIYYHRWKICFDTFWLVSRVYTNKDVMLMPVQQTRNTGRIMRSKPYWLYTIMPLNLAIPQNTALPDTKGIIKAPTGNQNKTTSSTPTLGSHGKSTELSLTSGAPLHPSTPMTCWSISSTPSLAEDHDAGHRGPTTSHTEHMWCTAHSEQSQPP